MRELNVGEKIPSFELNDQDNNSFKLDKYLGKSNLVIYFYPKDDSLGCTREACSFRNNISSFNSLNAIVVGISSDSVKSHKRFSERHKLNFTLLSDPGGKVRKLFGVRPTLFGIIEGRVTFIVDLNGTVLHVFRSMTNPVGHIREALKALDQ